MWLVLSSTQTFLCDFPLTARPAVSRSPWRTLSKFDKARLQKEHSLAITMTYSMSGLSSVCSLAGKQNKHILLHIKQFYNVLSGTQGTSNCFVCCDIEAFANLLCPKEQISKWTCVRWHVRGWLYRCEQHALNFKEGCVEPESTRCGLTVKCLGLRVDTMSTFIRQGPKWNRELME